MGNSLETGSAQKVVQFGRGAHETAVEEIGAGTGLWPSASLAPRYRHSYSSSGAVEDEWDETYL
jgi:hypothetical protein